MPAHRAGKVYRVALIFTTIPSPKWPAPTPIHPPAIFVHGLRALGYHEGQNLVLERRSAEGATLSPPAQPISSLPVTSRPAVMI
jgi:hypothetical protein